MGLWLHWRCRRRRIVGDLQLSGRHPRIAASGGRFRLCRISYERGEDAGDCSDLSSANVSVPIQIHIGSADGDYIGSTPPQWSYKLNEALLNAGKAVELFVYQGQGHSFTGEAWQLFMTRAVEFFDEQLK